MKYCILSIWLALTAPRAMAGSDEIGGTFPPELEVQAVHLTNLVAFFPGAPLADVAAMAATNGLEASYSATHGIVQVLNHTTNELHCLRMPETEALRIALSDKNGNQIEKTPLGGLYGRALSQAEIERWRTKAIEAARGGSEKVRQSLMMRIFPTKDQYPVASSICHFSYADAFKITQPGEYRLSIQVRLIQHAKDSSGNSHYLVHWLPPTGTTIHVP
jgi:hypothetical protein